MSAPADPVARARLAVARFTGDAEQCRTALDMLGLLPDQIECAGTCATCGRRMIRKRHPGTPPTGWARREGPRRCQPCYRSEYHRARRAARPRAPKVLRGKAARPDFQDEVTQLRAQGLTWSAISAALGCSSNTARAAVVLAEGGVPWQRRHAAAQRATRTGT